MGRTSVVSLSALAALLILSSPARADTRTGVDAWSRGDFTAAVKEWQAQAGKGDADALYNLGQAYRLGKGLPQDMAKAEEMYGRAAALGHIQAADNYGLLIFQRGEQARAMPYVTAAAGRGDPRAQYLLGIAHFNGTLIAKDWVRAYALVSLAQQQGVGPATSAIRQMDGFIPLDQRQQAAQLAVELRSQAEATRARVLTAADLGAAVPTTAPARKPDPLPPRPQVATRPAGLATMASKATESDSPATAGADYARPVVAAAPRTQVAPSVATHVAAASTPAPRPAKVTTVEPAATASGPWRVQLGAFGVAANADALWARLKARSELSGHPRLNVKAGSVTKLQAGGFASQTAAKAACDKLVAAGTTCLATLN